MTGHEGFTYLADHKLSARDLLPQLQGHWKIENRLHWVRDVTFLKDDPPPYAGRVPVNWRSSTAGSSTSVCDTLIPSSRQWVMNVCLACKACDTEYRVPPGWLTTRDCENYEHSETAPRVTERLSRSASHGMVDERSRAAEAVY